MPAQQELALRLLHALLDVAADALAQAQVGEGVARPTEDAPQPGFELDRLEDLDLLLEREVGAVAGRVREQRRLGDGAEQLDDTTGPPGVEDVLEHGAVLARQLHRCRARRRLDDRVDLHPEGLSRARDTGPDGRPLLAPHHDGAHAVGQLPGLFDP